MALETSVCLFTTGDLEGAVMLKGSMPALITPFSGGAVDFAALEARCLGQADLIVPDQAFATIAGA